MPIICIMYCNIEGKEGLTKTGHFKVDEGKRSWSSLGEVKDKWGEVGAVWFFMNTNKIHGETWLKNNKMELF